MLRTLRRKVLRALSSLFSDRVARGLSRNFSRKLVEQLRTRATDDFLAMLLRGMASRSRSAAPTAPPTSSGSAPATCSPRPTARSAPPRSSRTET